MTIYSLGELRPRISPSAFVAPEATIIGDVVIMAGASIWPGAVLRGDNEPIVISEGSNVQEGAVLHTDVGFPLLVEEGATISHQAMLHGCTIRAGSLIGIQSVVLNGAEVGAKCLVGAGSMVTSGKKFAPGQLILGSPAAVKRPLRQDEIESILGTAARYVTRKDAYRRELRIVD
ncbi:gamma carbonic anhydrase family protein [Paraburkholderia oxyphila]|uniref:gamma carbonic anhydrase family protein n=1 Tax=Paraburkholderia oxyphila TaxID=614212 RepID=UPI000480DE0C|nr:gamma carbonic anhydrase family protein [Paraburkholderia oxyphila]